MRKFVQTIFFILIHISCSTLSLAQTQPQICLQRGAIPGISIGNDNDLTVTIDGLSKICLPPNDSKSVIVNEPSGGSLGGFVFNVSEKFNADSIPTARFSPSPILSLPSNLEGVIWIIDIRNQASSTGGRIIRCKSIEVVRQKAFQATLTQCTANSGVFQITPAAAFANSPTRFSVVGVGVSREINNTLLSGQTINFPAGTNIATLGGSGGLNVNTQYFFADRSPTSCSQFVPVTIVTTQAPPRIVSLDRSNSDNEVELRLENFNPNIPYAIERGDITGSRQTLVPSSIENPVRVPTGDQENVCFTVSVPSVCVSTARLTSNVVCSSWLTGDLAPITGSPDYIAQLAWTRLPSTLSIMGEELTHGALNFLNPLNPPKFDKLTTCSGTFTYLIRQRYQATDGFNVLITSNTLDLDPAKGVSPPKEKLFVSMAGDASPRVEVNASGLLIDQLPNLFFEQKQPDGTFQPTNLPKLASFTVDVPNDPAGAHCFRYGREICGFKSPVTPENCVIQNTLGDDFTISWTAFDGAPTGSGPPVYNLQFTNKETDPTFSTPDFLTPTQDLERSLREILSRQPTWSQFLVRTFTQTTENGTPSYAYPVEVFRPLTLHLPNAFTPNEDGVNDFFRIENAFSGTGVMRIYNRLGQIIFATEDISQGWDGRNSRGTLLPTGMYRYEVEVTNDEGQMWKRVGSVFLVR